MLMVLANWIARCEPDQATEFGVRDSEYAFAFCPPIILLLKGRRRI